MKIILIDPETRVVGVENIDRAIGPIVQLLGSKPMVSARFPNGDRIVSAKEATAANGFSIGGSRVITGPGLVVGKRDDDGGYTSPRSGVETIVRLVRWVVGSNTAVASNAELVTAVLVDPEAGTIARIGLSTDSGAMDRAIGGRSRLMMRVGATDLVFVKAGSSKRGWCWRKDKLAFPGRSLIVGCDRYGALTSTTADVEDFRKTVEFKGPGGSDWRAP